jgi:hypothetical protein
VFWNVDPAPLIVPLTAGELVLDGLGDDEHAESATSAARIATPPAPIVIRLLPRDCIVDISLSDCLLPG